MAKSHRAMEKFSEESIADYMKLYPEWKESDFTTLRDQFMSFDVNEARAARGARSRTVPARSLNSSTAALPPAGRHDRQP